MNITKPQTVDLAEIRKGPNGQPMILQSGMWIAIHNDQVPFVIEAAKHAEDIKAGKSVSFDYQSQAKFQMTVSYAPFSKKAHTDNLIVKVSSTESFAALIKRGMEKKKKKREQHTRQARAYANQEVAYNIMSLRATKEEAKRVIEKNPDAFQAGAWLRSRGRSDLANAVERYFQVQRFK